MKAFLCSTKHCIRLCTPALVKDPARRGTLHIRHHSNFPINSNNGADNDEFFHHTSGRWLWNEKERMRERYRPFDVDRLKDIAARVTGAQRCVTMCKLAEGGFNKVFRLTMDDGQTIIARIPNQTSKTVSYSLASEVATMDFASKILGIPVPKVLSWDDDTNNSVRSEYVLMTEARGTPLYLTWKSMDFDLKTSIVKQLVSIEKKLLSASFSWYGNIYFSSKRFPGCESLRLHGAIDPGLKAQAEERFVIGPITEDSFWDGQRREMSGIRGPWSTPPQYVRAICEREIHWLRNFADPEKISDNVFEPAIEKDPAVHIALYEKLRDASDYLFPADAELTRPSLWHWDLHAPNIFVQDGKITDIIDWQDCWTGPLMLQARRSALINYHGKVQLDFPEEYDEIEDEDEKKRIRSEIEQSRLLRCYEDETLASNPELTRVFRDASRRETIREAIAFAVNTWDGGLLELRECLIRIHRYWNEICPGQPPPFTLTQDERAAHVRDGEGYNETADFWAAISGLVKRDGYVLNEDYDQALEMFASLRKSGLETLEGEERRQFEKATRWAQTTPSVTR